MMLVLNRSSTWEQLAIDGEFKMDAVAVINGVEYNTITAPIISRSLFSDDTLSIGNCIAGSLKFTLMTTDTIPKSASVIIKGRITDGTTNSEWLNFGTFWVSQRSAYNDLIDFECYDAMLKGNQAYSDNSQTLTWPKTVATVVTRIAQQMGINIDSRTTSAIINSNIGSMNIITKPKDDETLLDVLGYIGGVFGGNWTITPNNELRFVPVIDIPSESNYLLDNDSNRIMTTEDDYLIWHGTAGEHAEPVHPAGGGTVDVPVVTGSITTAKNYTISKVTLSSDAEHTYSYGNTTGYHIVVQNNPYASDALCQALYTQLYGIEYAPFALTGAVYDPAVELGDWIYVGDDIGSVVYSQTITMNVAFSSNVSAPGEDELESEYPYQTAMQKLKYEIDTTNAAVGVNRTTIEQTQTQVSIIAENYTPKTSVRSYFAIDPTNITLSAGVDQQGNPTGRITFNAGTLVVNSTNFSLDADGIMTCNGAIMKSSGDVLIDGVDRTSDVQIKDGVIDFKKDNTSAFQIHCGGMIGTDVFEIYNDEAITLTSPVIYVRTPSSVNVSVGWTGTTDGMRFINGILVGFTQQ